jgi:hypothetical protein
MYQYIQLTINHSACHFDVLLPSHENQNISHRHRKMDLQNLLNSAVDVVLTRSSTMEDLDRERSAGDGVVGRLTEELGELLRKGVNLESNVHL